MQRYPSIVLAIFLSILALTQVYCTPEADPREKITELRVLGIKASPPAAKPGDNVKLSALVATSTAAPIELEWFLCKNEKDAEHGCHESPDAVKLGKAATVNLTIPTSTLQAKLTPAEQLQGRILPITMIARAGKEIVIATKRIIVSATPANHNPKISALTLFDKDEKTALPTPWTLTREKQTEQTYKLIATVDKKSREIYQRITPDGKKIQANERLYLSWYLTDGAYKKGYLSEADDLSNSLVISEKTTKPGKLTLYLILRDGRGGVDWMTYTATIK